MQEKRLLTQQELDLDIGVSVVQDRKRPGHTMNNDHLTNVQTVIGTDWITMMSELLTSEHTLFKCSNILQTGALMKQKKGGGGTHFRKEPGNHRMLVSMILACNQIFAVKMWILNKISVQIQTSTL